MNQTQAKKRSHLANPMYDLLLFISQIVLPFIGAVMFVTAKRYDRETIDLVGYIVVGNFCLGLFLKWINYRFKKDDANYDGTITFKENDDKKTISLNYNGDPDELDLKKQAIFKIETTNK